MRPIDADALIDKLPTYYFGSPIHLLINDAPTIQVEQLHGEWILECDSEGEGDNLYRCSKCGCEYGCQEYDKPNFCPDCGAKMYKGGGK
jgi:DNA-directed RNA polymerase subunit RPC12/RpoP